MIQSARLTHALLANAVFALILHLWFRTHEPKTVLHPLSLMTMASLPSAFVIHSRGYIPLSAFLISAVTLNATLALSILIYRLSPYHSLARYPGPWQCRVSKLWLASFAWGGKTHEYIHKLHEKYGDIIRVGPNELSIRDVTLIPTTIGSLGMPKGPMWEGRRLLPTKNFNPNNSLTGVRDLRRHAVLRKPWDAAFKPSALVPYEEMLLTRADQFVKKLKELLNTPEAEADLSSWINRFTFDFMGDIAFGGTYSLLQDGDPNGILAGLKRAVFAPSVAQHIPWIQNALLAVPGIGKDTRTFGKFGVSQATKRYSMNDSMKYKDLFYYMLEDLPPDQALPRLVSSSCLAIVAGSDTTSSVLSNIVYYLLREPKYLEQLRNELDAAFGVVDANGTIKLEALASLPFLNAVINEALRLQPPVPTGLQRAPARGSGGKQLSTEMYISEGTNVLVAPYAFHRSPHYFFPKPEEFWPERWIIKNPEIILNRSAFIPFSNGPSSCPGKLLAMTELRYITCLLFRTFDIKFAPEYNSSQWEEELQDRFVLVKGSLPAVLSLRRK
ncbi:cytochrome P450 [Crepidotus variabilis]|uniref:Cytochrome P450 n=1 Tax=Crepidotus variabilis TaxID=179855 RepID=A0A9P6JQK2_9AGAR|nr:cytochrome P450 [Crepidotus variabilis]